MNKKRVFIIHGWEGTPEANWLPWLKKELEERGFLVEAPVMPNTNNPKFSKWLPRLKGAVGRSDGNTYLVGHSLGVITILRYLESSKSEEKIGGAIFVAGFPETIGYEEINSFFETPLNYNKVKDMVGKITAIHSDNDPFVPVKNGEILRDKLGAELIVIPAAGHFNESDGFTQLPAALDSLLIMSGEGG